MASWGWLARARTRSETAANRPARVSWPPPRDLDSYPAEADADALIHTGGLGHPGPLGEIVDAAGEAFGPLDDRPLGRGLKSSRVTTVGQESGQATTEIRLSQQTGYRAGNEISYDLEAETTAPGVVLTGTAGERVEAGISWGSGSSTIYRGTVGSIDAANRQARVGPGPGLIVQGPDETTAGLIVDVARCHATLRSHCGPHPGPMAHAKLNERRRRNSALEALHGRRNS